MASETAFAAPVDIANRAIQHLGARRIVAFTDDSVEASEVAFVYDKVRKAELRRNNWRFAIKRAALRAVDDDTMLFVPAAWDATIPYQAGAVVKDTSGTLWVSQIANNQNIIPGSVSYAWDVYFGPLTAEPYDSTLNYFTGELVYENPRPGVYRVFSLLTENTTVGDPGVPTAWSSTATYTKSEVVQYTDGYLYMSLIDRNTGNTPGQYVPYDTGVTYAQNDQVIGPDGHVYSSLVDSNTGNDPTTSPAFWADTTLLAPWTPSFEGNTAAIGWIKQYATLVDLRIIYPIGTGPASNEKTRNVFRLPNGYMRRAPQDPKAGITPFLGAPAGIAYDDWVLEGNYLTSSFSTPIALRFSADITFVPAMDEMFCEGLAARIAMETCERITQADTKMKTVSAAYKWFMDEARTVNGIETGATEPPEDEWLTVRR